MYPDDQDREQQPANRNLMGDAPQPFNYGQQMQANLGQPVQQKGGKPKSGGNKMLPWIVSGILLLLVIIFGILFLLAANKDKNKDNNTTDNTNTNQTQNNADESNSEECSSKLRRYQNEDLDIRFCYPKTWGDVKLTDGKLDPSDSGTTSTPRSRE
jgi:hypothetical protein